ncbi:hypothetical protein KGP17_23785 [Serratia sp. JSRIV001]|uniref:hypothetical protein n=1 Tax=Serratia sp. JSRIV001 TaxID=2831893 RepID=UPI001CBE082D|nr:hypothetical protein [Serratia sp. JSRIV001]UAN45364.1 hypothetical protein KGP17_23785 [Serratia sp. JSRIV001]
MACDLGLVSIVRVTFRGKESLHLPRLLAIDAASQASGIAIGMETLAGKPLPLGLVGQKYPQVKGNNLITLKAYVQGELQAIANQNIKCEPLTVVATFSLEYE